eukprot:7236647-Prymnesium_polylepis.1
MKWKAAAQPCDLRCTQNGLVFTGGRPQPLWYAEVALFDSKNGPVHDFGGQTGVGTLSKAPHIRCSQITCSTSLVGGHHARGSPPPMCGRSDVRKNLEERLEARHPSSGPPFGYAQFDKLSLAPAVVELDVYRGDLLASGKVDGQHTGNDRRPTLDSFKRFRKWCPRSL